MNTEQAREDDRILYRLGLAPNPDAVCIEPHEVNEDNEHRVSSNCNAGVLFEGYDYAGEHYFCTIECFKAFATSTNNEDMQDRGLVKVYLDPAHGSRRICSLTDPGLDLTHLLLKPRDDLEAEEHPLLKD